MSEMEENVAAVVVAENVVAVVVAENEESVEVAVVAHVKGTETLRYYLTN